MGQPEDLDEDWISRRDTFRELRITATQLSKAVAEGRLVESTNRAGQKGLTASSVAAYAATAEPYGRRGPDLSVHGLRRAGKRGLKGTIEAVIDGLFGS